MISFKQFIKESINDKGILKAVFVIGIPGAGKSYTVKQLNGSITPRVVNTDKAGEFLSTKLNTPINSSTWSAFFKDSATRMTRNALEGYLDGMLPLFIDGTSNDASNILHRMGILESLGYDVGIVYVSTSLEVAKARAKAREQEIGRAVDEDFIEAVHSRSEENAHYLKSKVMFFKEIDNSGTLNDQVMAKAFKAVQGFFEQPVENPVGKRALEQLKEEQQKYLVPSVISKEILSKKTEGWYKR